MSQPQTDTQKQAKANAQWLLEHAQIAEEEVLTGDYEGAELTLDYLFEYASRLMTNLEDLQ